MTRGFKLVGAAVLAAFLVLALGSALSASEATKPASSAQTQCPISGKAINKEHYVDQDGKRVYFCCPACPPEFKKDPGKYMREMEMKGVVLEDAPAAGQKPANPAMPKS